MHSTARTVPRRLDPSEESAKWSAVQSALTAADAASEAGQPEVESPDGGAIGRQVADALSPLAGRGSVDDE
eukprot:950344-Prorocentrum_minimum.AAC.1